MMGDMGLGMGLFDLIIMLIFWGALLVLAIWLVGLLFPTPKKPNNHTNSTKE